MNFYRGMRRLAWAIWALPTIALLLAGYFDHQTDLWRGAGFAAAAVGLWSFAYWALVALIRWIWLGFVAKDAPKS